MRENRSVIGVKRTSNGRKLSIDYRLTRVSVSPERSTSYEISIDKGIKESGEPFTVEQGSGGREV